MAQVLNLRATKGRVPHGALLIDRRTRWGNPFRVETWGRLLAVQLYYEMASGFWNGPAFFRAMTDGEFRLATDLRDQWLKRLGGHPVETIRVELRGWDLACWCAPELCHGHALLALAQGKPLDVEVWHG